METKTYKKGSIGWGLSILIASICLIAFLMIFDLCQDSTFQYGPYGFTCIGCSILLFLIMLHALVMLYNGLASRRVALNGHLDSGVITKLWVEKKTINGNTKYKYYLKFQYTDENGKKAEQKERVSFKEFERLQNTQMVPILVLKERAVFDQETFIEQNKDFYASL